ncbi:hypothetical protein LCGC14_0607550 [marine sediment metagenome]|uniref:Uncharacterized protein n=1 Tax=marine sediment metagenome TaxID=412755 RepID=A0A0F9RDJ3_9ZZZZ
MADKPEKKRMEFPIKGHDKCPDCGCEDRLGQMKIAEMVEEGLIDEKLFPKGPTWVLTLIDPSKPIVISPLSITKPKIPIMSFYWDVCANPECLKIFTTLVDFRMQEIEIPNAPIGPGMGGQQFPKFGR